jgi:metallophosphoesterase (TIGR00282 family)
MRLVFIGDAVGKAGIKALTRYLPEIIDECDPDLVVANGENFTGGRGINQKTAQDVFNAGVDIITGGNHIWDNYSGHSVITKDDRILRPLNYPKGVPGQGYVRLDINGTKAVIVSLLGRVFINAALDCPFQCMDTLLASRSRELVIVDFHAEATSEKQYLFHHLDGRVSAVIGTHTHVQTSDARISGKGTAYISDAGMCGNFDSVIGVPPAEVGKRFLTGMPVTLKECAKTNLGVNAVFADIDDKTFMARSIRRINKGSADFS